MRSACERDAYGAKLYGESRTTHHSPPSPCARSLSPACAALPRPAPRCAALRCAAERSTAPPRAVRSEAHFLSAETPSGPPPAPLARAQLGMLRVALYPYIASGNLNDAFEFALGLGLISSAGWPRTPSEHQRRHRLTKVPRSGGVTVVCGEGSSSPMGGAWRSSDLAQRGHHKLRHRTL